MSFLSGNNQQANKMFLHNKFTLTILAYNKQTSWTYNLHLFSFPIIVVS